MLIELMIAVVIVALLAAIAVSAYTETSLAQRSGTAAAATTARGEHAWRRPGRRDRDARYGDMIGPETEPFMSEIPTRALFIVLIALGFACAQSDAQQLYRWVDKEGRVHYTQTPPPSGAAQNVRRKDFSDGVVESSGLSYAAQMAMRNYPVTLYSSADCGAPCKDAQNYLNKRGVSYRDVIVSDAKGVEELKTIAGSSQVPVMKVGAQVLVGFEPGQWKEALDIAGYPASAPPVGPSRSRQPSPAKAAAAPLPPVRLYTNSKCGSPCAEAKQFLNGRGVGYEEVAVESAATFEELRKKSGGAAVPVLAIGENMLVSYSPERWAGALDAAGFARAGARTSKR